MAQPPELISRALKAALEAIERQHGKVGDAIPRSALRGAITAALESLEIKSFRDLIALWPNAEELAWDTRVKGTIARAWKHRNNIPPRYWPRVLRAAAKRGYHQVTIDLLLRLASNGGSIVERAPRRAKLAEIARDHVSGAAD